MALPPVPPAKRGAAERGLIVCRCSTECANTWTKSSSSGGSGCVEVRQRGNWYDVRDSKNPSGPTLTFNQVEWCAFIAGVARGEFGHADVDA